MRYYAQINENNVCVAVSQLSQDVESKYLILLPSFSDQYLGKKYNNGIFCGLEAKAEGTNISVFWRDMNGNLVDETEEVKAVYGNVEVVVEMRNGQGSFTVDASPGTYRIEIISKSGCRTEVEVVINA